MKQLILGGVRSGKSHLAEQAAVESALTVTYIATALPSDEAMQHRIALHRQRRPESWAVAEAPYALATCLKQYASTERCLLVDCLTSWLTNLLCVENQTQFEKELNAFLETLPTLPGRIIFVSNETSMGIVPLGELTRRFCDEAGLLHQAVAQQCEQVILCIAGLPHILKNESVESLTTKEK
ncbi:MAG: bifunctional adenosylcobinamide kinase/adenosylcobinamide-phosphate guanylyltransferase [Gammaproteobacteria bacterium]|nr:bifunctional adenosylcobinamide kinase/adenosylcobinamide-phosphate guanylyltransferase [Gammaproteobacteria bacterium]